MPSTRLCTYNIHSTHLCTYNIHSTHLCTYNIHSTHLCTYNIHSTHLCTYNIPSTHLCTYNIHFIYARLRVWTQLLDLRCKCIHKFIYICIYVYMCMYIYVCKYIYIYVYMHRYIHASIYSKQVPCWQILHSVHICVCVRAHCTWVPEREAERRIYTYCIYIQCTTADAYIHTHIYILTTHI